MLWPALRWSLFRLDPEGAHAVAAAGLKAMPLAVARRLRPAVPPALRVRCLGLDLEGPVGLAAGFDKGEVLLPGLFALGFSHVEIGTVTPRPQHGNERPRAFRLPEHRALINRMGFNNDGAEACAARLEALAPGARLAPIGLNVGKNKVTPNEEAIGDYLACIDRLHDVADYLVVNISSPNTPGLRALQDADKLDALLRACMARVRERSAGPGEGDRAATSAVKPLLVKLAADLPAPALDEAVDVALSAGVAGLIVSNTTVSRAGVERHPRATEAGGLSGAPLSAAATAAVRRCAARVAGRAVIVGSGGIMSAGDAYAKIRAGASLVQVYTGLVYGGPTFVRDVHEGIAALLERDGFASIAEAVGADLRGSQGVAGGVPSGA